MLVSMELCVKHYLAIDMDQGLFTWLVDVQVHMCAVVTWVIFMLLIIIRTVLWICCTCILLVNVEGTLYMQ